MSLRIKRSQTAPFFISPQSFLFSFFSIEMRVATQIDDRHYTAIKEVAKPLQIAHFTSGFIW